MWGVHGRVGVMTCVCEANLGVDYANSLWGSERGICCFSLFYLTSRKKDEKKKARHLEAIRRWVTGHASHLRR